MRLRDEQIERLTVKVVGDLVAAGLIATERGNAIAAEFARLVRDNIAAEAALDEDVHALLRQYADEINRGDIHHHDMFRMIKQRLAKERNFPL